MNGWTLSALGAVAVLLAVANRRDAVLGDPADVELGGGELEPGQGGDALESALATLDPLTYFPSMNDTYTADANTAAFLRVIRAAEGTAGANGYRMLFGGRLFDSYADHPRQAVQFTDGEGRTLWTSAAGAYQFMAVSPLPGGKSTRVDTWDRVRARLGLVDFSPASQDAAALQLIDDAGALNDVRAGRFEQAIAKVRRIWASLPGAGYGQGERSLSFLRSAYLTAGGAFA